MSVFLFLSLSLYFRSGLFYSLTHTPHHLTVITMTLSIKYSLSFSVDLRTSLRLSLSLCLSCLRLHTKHSDVVVQAALREVASVCHKIWITLFYTVLPFRRTPLHPLALSLGLNVIDLKEHPFKNTRSLKSGIFSKQSELRSTDYYFFFTFMPCRNGEYLRDLRKTEKIDMLNNYMQCSPQKHTHPPIILKTFPLTLVMFALGVQFRTAADK